MQETHQIGSQSWHILFDFSIFASEKSKEFQRKIRLFSRTHRMATMQSYFTTRDREDIFVLTTAVVINTTISALVDRVRYGTLTFQATSSLLHNSFSLR